MAAFIKAYSLGIALFILFVLSWIIQWATHTGSITEFLNASAENWQSEFLQLLCQVVFPVYMLYRKSPVSRDTDDEMEANIKAIRAQADRIEKAINRQ